MIQDLYDYIDQILYEFDGQLSLNDIYNTTFKEIAYLRKHRLKIREERAKNPTLKDLVG